MIWLNNLLARVFPKFFRRLPTRRAMRRMARLLQEMPNRTMNLKDDVPFHQRVWPGEVNVPESSLKALSVPILWGPEGPPAKDDEGVV